MLQKEKTSFLTMLQLAIDAFQSIELDVKVLYFLNRKNMPQDFFIDEKCWFVRLQEVYIVTTKILFCKKLFYTTATI